MDSRRQWVRLDRKANPLTHLALLEAKTIQAIFVTHAHADHIGALPPLSYQARLSQQTLLYGRSVLPTHRVVAYYVVPYAEPTGPAYEPTDTMLAALVQQGAAYGLLDPELPVHLGIDLVVSVPDAYPSPQGTYSYHVDAGTIQTYLDFCREHHLILFLDLDIG